MDTAKQHLSPIQDKGGPSVIDMSSMTAEGSVDEAIVREIRPCARTPPAPR